jgi:hypothetical protein
VYFPSIPWHTGYSLLHLVGLLWFYYVVLLGCFIGYIHHRRRFLVSRLPSYYRRPPSGWVWRLFALISTICWVSSVAYQGSVLRLSDAF